MTEIPGWLSTEIRRWPSITGIGGRLSPGISTRATDPDAEEMTIQLMGLIITFGEILAETVEYVIADETGTQSV